MISIGSRDGRKGLGLGLEMEDTELEEGEALGGYNDVDGDSTVDPDIALSYIEEKLQNVLGHFQKDFEGGVSAENLGAKFGGYGSFLPTYQRSPTWSHTRSPQNIHNHATPRSSRKLHTEDQIQNSLASSTVTPSARPPAASGKTSSMGNYSKSGVCVPSNHTEEFTSKSGVTTKSADPSDQRTLKVRIKVGAENLSTQKNADIYSGLGLVVSPSSSLDDSPSTSERLHGDQLDVPDESPTSILQIMTSFPGGVLLSPLSEDLLYLTERRKPRVKSESKPVDKTSLENSGTPMNGSRFSRTNQKVFEQKKMRSSEENGAFSTELTKEKSNGDKDNTGSLLKKERETNLDSLGCEELVSNALKLPLLSSSEYSISDPVKGMSLATTIPMRALKDGLKEEIFSEGRFDSKFSQDIGSIEKSGGKMGSLGKVSDSKKENLISKTAAYSQQDVLEAANPHSSDQSESNVPRGRNSRSAEPIDSTKQLVGQKGGSLNDEGFKAARENSSTGGKKKQKGLKNQLIADSPGTAKIGKSSHANGLLPKTQKDSEKPLDRYKEFFGDVEFDDGDNESISGEMTSSGRLKDPQPLVKKSMNERPNKSKEKRNIRSSEKPRPPESYPGAGSHAAPPLGNESNSEAPSLIIPPPNDDWVCCERCQKWRLLPLGMDPQSLPDEWICRMLTWLPGMNRCSVPEEVTTSSVKALYHPVAPVPAPATEGQLDLVNNPVPTLVASVDARYSGQEQQNIAIKTPSISGKKKHGSKNPTNSIDLDGSTHSSNSKRKSLPTSIRNGNSNSGNRTPSLDGGGYQHVQKSSSDIERHNDNKKDKKVSLVSCSDKGTNLKIRRKRESDLDGPRPSKRSKGEELRDDENWTSDNGESLSKAGRGSTSGLPINASGNDRHKYANHKNTREESRKNINVGVNPETQVPGTSADGLPRSSKSDDKDSVRKRKWKEHINSQIQTEPLSSSGRNLQDSGGFMEEMCENGPQKEKKARVSKSGLKDSSVGKDQKVRSADNLKSDMGSLQHSVAANSSSSKVSGSHKKKTSAQEVNGSPVESVSSSPLRFSVSNADKVSSTRSNLEKNDTHDSGSLTAVTPRRFSVGEDDGGNDPRGMVKKDPILTDTDCETDVYSDRLRQNNQYSSEKHTSERGQVEEKINPDQSRNSGSQSKKSGKGLSSHSKERDRASGSDLEKEKTKASDFSHDEKSKNRRTQFDEKSGTPRKADKFIVKKDTAEGTTSESSKGQSKIKSGGHDAQDKRQHHQQEREDEKLPKKHNHAEANGNGKSHLLPPLARVQTEISGSQKQNGSKVLAGDSLDNGDSSKAPYQSRKAENQNGQPIVSRHATPNSHKGRDVEAPSPLRRDSSSYTANSALKEAKDLKHAADRLKNSGSTDSNGFYFQAALKFLQGASLLESGSGEGTKHNDIMHAVHIYSSTAKLCDFCAREYERSKDMAAAALAYKCMEVAYMRVVYSANTNASRDRVELQSALQIVPPGESPSSSASDVDNLNQQGTTDKASLAKVAESPQVSGSHIITSRNRTGVSRLLSFAENVNLAMEASRKSRNAFTAATSALGETSHREGIGSVKKALDFNFQDVGGLLRLVRVAMEDITR